MLASKGESIRYNERRDGSLEQQGETLCVLVCGVHV